jgi:hypothetical protein
MTASLDLIRRIKIAIKAARDNGFGFADYSDEDLAADLAAYEESVENENIEDIKEAVKIIREERGGKF